MDCASALERLSERLDGMLEPGAAAALDDHLAGCAACREAEAQLVQLDGLCRRAIPQPLVAERLGTRVSRELSYEVPSRRSIDRSKQWTVFLAGAVALAAAVLLLVFGPMEPREVVKDSKRDVRADDPVVPQLPLFEISVVSGDVEECSTAGGPWSPAGGEQPIGAAVRTLANGLCEFRCPSGGTVRLDCDSEVELTAPDSLTMRRGRLWCQATEDTPLKIVAAKESTELDISALATCQPNSEMQTSISPKELVRVISAGGDVEVMANGKPMQLAAGQVLQLKPGTEQVYATGNLTLETLWMAPLLAKRGPKSAEFRRQINEMLANVGQTKAAYLYEDQLLKLGGPGAIPLIEFLRSSAGSNENVDRRYTAARIISQTAPEESIPDLVELLEDNVPDVRIAAATALERLTGLTHGVAPEEWQTIGPEQMESLNQWRAWLKASGRVPA